MQPHPFLTVRFVKRFLMVFIGGILLLFIFPDYAEIIWGVILIGGVLTGLFLQSSFPQTQITVDEETISFKREFPTWHPLRKYHLHELIVPHTAWNNWVKVSLSDEEGDIQNFYLFFRDTRLSFTAETTENSDLEFWVQTKFPERPLQITTSFKKYRDS